MEQYPLWAWAGFLAVVAIMLALDLGVFRRKGHVIGLREALTWCAVWVTLALAFNALVWWWHGRDPALEFLAGYLVELSLSVDNVFVFILVFSYFKVPPALQHRVLFWGILGAAVMRAIFIAAGIIILEKLDWVIFVFGAFLIYTGIKMALPRKEEIDPDKNPVVRLFRRLYPVAADYDGNRFFTRTATGAHVATPLFIVLLVIETTDVVFAVDSIPAILAITQDAFIVFTSNIFAILGLRSFYFALAGVIRFFRYLPFGLAVVLSFIGVKMVLSWWYHIPTEISLAVIGSVLALSVLLSLIVSKKDVHSGQPGADRPAPHEPPSR